MNKIKTILLISFLASLPAAVFALENQYPILPGTSNPTTLVRFVNYIYVFTLFLGGALALIQLILAGSKFIWGSPGPNEIADAKQQIKAALLGLAILLCSFLILRTINPQLTNLSGIPPLTSFPKSPLPPGPQDSIFRGDLMERIKKMAEEIKTMLSDNVKKAGEDIQKATQECKCSGAASLCFCDKAGREGVCKPQKCYVTEENQPCKKEDRDKIRDNQRKIIFFKDAILYYKNRAPQEEKDLSENIKVIDEKIKWYQDSIQKAEENIRNSKTQTDRNYWQETLNKLNEGRTNSLKEKDNKSKIITQLTDLERYLESLPEPLLKITELPEKCASEVENKCQAACKDKKDEGYGCYEAVLGCQPDKCQGGNPCPQEEINYTNQSINGLTESALIVLEKIIQIINFLEQSQ